MRPQIVQNKWTVTESLSDIFKANNLFSFFSILNLFQNFTSVKVFTVVRLAQQPTSATLDPKYACYQTNVPFDWSILHLNRSESKHTSASRKILAQVQEASRRMAGELEGKYPNSKVWGLETCDLSLHDVYGVYITVVHHVSFKPDHVWRGKKMIVFAFDTLSRFLYAIY